MSCSRSVVEEGFCGCIVVVVVVVFSSIVGVSSSMVVGEIEGSRAGDWRL